MAKKEIKNWRESIPPAAQQELHHKRMEVALALVATRVEPSDTKGNELREKAIAFLSAEFEAPSEAPSTD